ncbi:MAG TPA: hypothetical protein VOA41_01975 [Candidatus Dormibacteraeota bacterium]|nr:hypothetical protein [Candidatus Dormibacteraeota bacterium]
MRTFALITGICLIAFFVSGNANACGDKLLLLSRGLRFERSVSAHPASVLMFVRPNSRAATIAADSQPALEQAGHKIRTVQNIDEVADTLNSAAYDLLLADVEDVPAIEQRIGSMSTKPLVVPVVYKGWKQDSAPHSMQYAYVLVSPGKVGNYVSAIDKAMKLKLKRQKS